MAFKGKSMIELRNAETGEVEQRVEDENMVTNAAYNLVNGGSYFNQISSNFLNGSVLFNRLLDNAFGGLLLFEKAIPEDVNNIFPQRKNKFVGCAGTEYNGTDIFRGNLNVTESTEINSGYRYVWDFPTDKANGTIRSVCLTSKAGGNTGLNNNLSESGYFLNSIRNLNTGVDYNTIGDVLTVCTGFHPIGIFNKNEVTCYKAGTGSIIFKKIKFNNKMTLTKNASIQEQEVTISINKGIGHNLQQVGDKIYSAIAVTANQIDLMIIDGKTLNIDREETLTIQDASFLVRRSGNAASDIGGTVVYLEGYLYLFHSDYTRVYEVNIEDPSDYKIAYTIERKVESPTSMALVKIGPYVSTWPGYWYTAHQTLCLYDGENIMYTNINLSSKNFSMPVFIDSPYILPPFFGVADALTVSDKLMIKIFTPFLSTINNLSTPVVKNETQTMKVTYEITEI